MPQMKQCQTAVRGGLTQSASRWTGDWPYAPFVRCRDRGDLAEVRAGSYPPLMYVARQPGWLRHAMIALASGAEPRILTTGPGSVQLAP